MISLRMLRAQMARVKGAPEGLQPVLLYQLAGMVNRRKRERGPSKLARRMRRKQELGMAGVF